MVINANDDGINKLDNLDCPLYIISYNREGCKACNTLVPTPYCIFIYSDATVIGQTYIYKIFYVFYSIIYIYTRKH